MKITKSKLREIIKEEIDSINEWSGSDFKKIDKAVSNRAKQDWEDATQKFLKSILYSRGMESTTPREAYKYVETLLDIKFKI